MGAANMKIEGDGQGTDIKIFDKSGKVENDI